MAHMLSLELFSSNQISEAAKLRDNFDLSETKNEEASYTAAFEKGYKAGWNDASAAEAEDQSRISAEIARNFQDLGFTFHEARGHVLRSLESLVVELVNKIFPEIIFETMGKAVVHEVMQMAENAADKPIEVVVSPNTRSTIEPLFEEIATTSIELVEETSLEQGQIFIRVGSCEKHVDFTRVLGTVSKSLSAMYQTNERQLKHG